MVSAVLALEVACFRSKYVFRCKHLGTDRVHQRVHINLQFFSFRFGAPSFQMLSTRKAKLTGSSRTVFVKGIGVGRRGDRADFGAMTGASQNVFAG